VWLTQQPMPISRHGLASSTVGENIYLIGGGVIPGFSVSAITEKYHNTIIPTSSKIPHWVENILAWYEEGGISEDEMRNAIEWLMNQGILKGDYLEKELSTQTLQSCSGSARCITGVVTKVIDGDTIKVDGQSIRFALASAPELGSYGAGVKETEFIQSICPVGSTALVDEDDEQTQGSYGRIVGVVYCNGMNLKNYWIQVWDTWSLDSVILVNLVIVIGP